MAARIVGTSRGLKPVASGDTRREAATPSEPIEAPLLSARPETVQPDLEFGTAQAIPSVPTPDFLAALNFPETAEDRAGFDALRRRQFQASEVFGIDPRSR